MINFLSNYTIEDHVSFEVAKLLKDKGFNECPLFRYDDCGQLLVQGGYNKTIRWHFPAPTIQMARKWLRKVYKIDIVVYPYGNYSSENYQFDVYKNRDLIVSKDDGYIIYEQACEEAIKYCLENLI